MRIRLLPLATVLVVVLLAAAAAQAQAVPDLVGTWKSVAHEGITTGSRHFPKNDSGPHFVSSQFVLHIERQEGRRFVGVKSSPHHKETVMGVIGYDGSTIHILEDEGSFTGKLLPDGSLELVYSHDVGASKGIGIARYVREAK
ncbi:hypothetical protein [Solidesulfovibrio magneticus]|uniref:Lipocalin-like domain-containing protein n=1 Tax=Solidesulfovibrio magneticus (strain ATCC 700980 / DSM 13731 / RS-1) TaxID=573370 RepID=C4XIV6_SOLM1|nr:hypothetical protein [Solidesulfovibrio magneticus]BAH74120.1 hypothetical protein DMR_06290 [Solidesulfovibrio magneticus RS-1]